jgi:transcriptional regulator with XRE-family HTH domain
MKEKKHITPEQMKEWRERNRFSMAQAARRAGVDRSTWSKWERGIARPTAINEDQLRSVMDNFEVSLRSTRTKETFGPLCDDELSDLLYVAYLAEQQMGSPMALRSGPRRSDTRMEKLALWFERYFRLPPDTPYSVSVEDETLFVEVGMSAVAAGFSVGSFKYAVTDDDAEEWYQAAESLFIDLMGMKKIFERDNPKKGEEFWREAFGERFHEGYAAAVEQRYCGDSAWHELRVLEGMLFDTTNIPMVRSVMSPEDFAEPLHRLMFQAILDLFEEGSPIDVDTVESRLKAVAPQGAMDRYHWSWPLYREGLDEGGTFVGYLFYYAAKPVDPNDLMLWVMEIQQRALSRRLMDGCRKISNCLELGQGLDACINELEQTIVQLKSLATKSEAERSKR